MNQTTAIQKSSVANDAVIKVCRYIRPVVLFKQGVGYSNLGGVTLVFTMDYGRRTVNVKFSICRDDENFNKKDGLSWAEKQVGETFNLDKFQSMADVMGGFTQAYLNLLNAKYVNESLTPRELTLSTLLQVA